MSRSKQLALGWYEDAATGRRRRIVAVYGLTVRVEEPGAPPALQNKLIWEADVARGATRFLGQEV